MFNIDSYIICGNDFQKEIETLESYMDSLMFEIATENVGSNSSEPDGSRLRSAYKDLSNAVQRNDTKKIQEASKEVNDASNEIDQKVKDPEKKKKIIKIAIAAASAAALTVGAIVVVNDLKKGDASKIRSALDVAKKSVSKIGTFVKSKKSNKLEVTHTSTVTLDSVKNYAKGKLEANPDKKIGVSVLDKEDLKKYGLDPDKKYLVKGLFTASGDLIDKEMTIIQYDSLEPKLQSLLDSNGGTVVITK